MAGRWLFLPLPLQERVGRGVAPVSSTLRTRRLVVPSPPHPNPLPRGEREPEVPAAKSVFANSTVLRLGPSRWRCLNRYCFTKDRWWMSRYDVVRCMNCQPPSFPWLIIEEGDAAKAPIVERERSSQAIGYACLISASVSRSPRDSSPASVAPSVLPFE